MSDSKEPPTDASDERANHMAEWQVARDTLQATDNNLHDLRKYGFSFVTALIAAESILLPSVSGGLPDKVKLGVFLVTLLLIFVLHLIDENYRALEEATAGRALVIERDLNLELTEIISDRYIKTHAKLKVFIVYAFFAISVLVLGFFAFEHFWPYVPWLAAFTLAEISAMIITFFTEKVTFRFGPGMDWTISPLECTDGDLVKITLTNLNSSHADMDDLRHLKNQSLPLSELKKKGKDQRVQKPIRLVAYKPIWSVEDDDGVPVYTKIVPNDVWVFHSYSWFWNTNEVLRGDEEMKVFSVHPLERLLPLDRKVTVRRRSALVA